MTKLFNNSVRGGYLHYQEDGWSSVDLFSRRKNKRHTRMDIRVPVPKHFPKYKFIQVGKTVESFNNLLYIMQQRINLSRSVNIYIDDKNI